MFHNEPFEKKVNKAIFIILLQIAILDEACFKNSETGSAELNLTDKVTQRFEL